MSQLSVRYAAVDPHAQAVLRKNAPTGNADTRASRSTC
jgi:hypothetical protein